MSFTPRFGYVQGEKSPDEVKLVFAAGGAPPLSYDSGFRNPLIVQSYSDCVPRSVAKAQRRSMARPLIQKAQSSPWPIGIERSKESEILPLPSSRWGYWHWLEETGRLGLTDSGTQPELYIRLLRERGWCSEEHMPYEVDGVVQPVDESSAPPLTAYRFSADQRNKLEAHFLSPSDTFGLRMALSHDLAACIAIACDERFVSPGGIPNDPHFTWVFDPALSEVGRHMMEVVAYDELGVLCQNTWGEGFGLKGFVRVGWENFRLRETVSGILIIDHTPLPSDAGRLLRPIE